VNTSQSGTLKLQEFVAAYQLLFTRPSVAISSGNSKDNLTQRKPTEVICAVRYGTDTTEKYLFEMYLGTVIDLPDGPLLTMNEKRIYQLFPDTDPANIDFELVENWSASLNELNELITQDSLNNKSKKTRLFWWIDVAMIKVAAHRMDKYIAGLGLPNDSKFRSAFSQFGTCLTRDEKSHVYLGNGLSTLGGVSSMNFFVQAIRVSRIPISHHIPLWLDYAFETFLPVSLKDSVKDYFYKRFAFLFSSVNSRSSDLAEESRNAYENSQIIVNVCLPLLPSPPLIAVFAETRRGRRGGGPHQTLHRSRRQSDIQSAGLVASSHPPGLQIQVRADLADVAQRSAQARPEVKVR
jgi:hypothetical protein